MMSDTSDHGEPMVGCPTCGERVRLTEGVGPVGQQTYTCPACGIRFRFGDDEAKPATDH